MCYDRILERLGVSDRRKANGKVRKPVRAELATAADYLRMSEGPRNRRTATHEVVQGMRTVIRAIDAWLNHRVTPELRVVLDAVYDLSKVERLETVTASIPNQILSPSQREKIVSVVMKIAKYRRVARYLYRTAKTFPVARDVRVVTVNLPPSAFEETRLDGYDPQVEAFFRKLHPMKLTLAGLCQRLSVSETGVQSSFHQDITNILGVSRIHAEVQLVVYCDTELAGSKPRVICSSKAACFLCNQIIKAHGKMYTPYCHGRLYTPWRLPKLGDGRLSRQLSSTLEEFTLKSLEKIRKRSARIRYPNPNESPTHTLLSSLTTLARPAPALPEELEGDTGVPGPAASVELPIAPEQPDTLAAPHQIPNMSLAALENQINSLTALPRTDSDVASGTRNARMSRRSSSERQMSTEKLAGTAEEDGVVTHRPHTVSTMPTEKVESPENALNPREAAWSKSFSVGSGTPLRVPTDVFDLLIARAPGAGDEAKGFVCHLATLTPGAAEAVLARNDLLVVAVDELDCERSLSLERCVAAPFYMSSGSCILEVTLREAEGTGPCRRVIIQGSS